MRGSVVTLRPKDGVPDLASRLEAVSVPRSDTLQAYLQACIESSQHSALKDEIEEQPTALYASARLWDDGIIKPTDTRDAAGLGLSLAKK